MTPRDDDDQGNYDDTELPDGHDHNSDSAETTGRSGKYDDAEIPEGHEHRKDNAETTGRSGKYDDTDTDTDT